jgi:hypothetical protein
MAAEADRAFPAIRDHVLLPHASSIREADARLAQRLPDPAALVALVPEEWLGDSGPEPYVEFLRARLSAPRGFAEEAERVRVG